ncbi:MAG: glutamine synthetase family protein [Alphaproteobacteria bacterium]
MSWVSVDELKSLVDRGEVNTIICAAPDHWGRLIGKRLQPRTFFDVALRDEGLHGSLFLMCVDMEMEPRDGYAVSDWTRGFQDFRFVPDLNTLRVIPWQPATAIVICDLYEEKSDSMISVAPRSILKNQLKRAASHGISLKCATELEFFLYRNSLEDAWNKRYTGLEPLSRYRSDYNIFQGTQIDDFAVDVRQMLSQADVEVESSKPEWGFGQQEINLRYTEALEMADRHSLFKMAVKEIAAKKGWIATFMAKPYFEDVGSSCHIHVSLWDKEGQKPLGWDESKDGNLSDTMNRFLGGTMAATRDFTVCYAPTVNSYKRLQPETFAPTKIAVGDDNRTCSHRLCGHGNSFRFENRIPGADVQPYIAISAAIASGLHGLTEDIAAPTLYAGNTYEDTDLEEISTSYGGAIDSFGNSSVAKAAFGEDAHAHLTQFYATEHDDFQRFTVTDWERIRYFERI